MVSFSFSFETSFEVLTTSFVPEKLNFMASNIFEFEGDIHLFARYIPRRSQIKRSIKSVPAMILFKNIFPKFIFEKSQK